MFIAIDPINESYEFFNTVEEAEKKLKRDIEINADQNDDEFSYDATNGNYLIAKIIKKSSVLETDNCENYKCCKDPKQKCDYRCDEFCDQSGDEDLQWQHEHDSIGEIEFIDIIN